MMGQTTTIPLDPRVRDRLRAFGTHGMNYSDIITSVLDKIEREEFVREMRRRADDPSVQWIRHEDINWD